MGGGAWTTCSYNAYMNDTKGFANVSNLSTKSVNQFYDAHRLDAALNPKGVKFRECRDSEEHPHTIPVILALDVTGSMGSACAAVARQLNEIMTKLYEKVSDVEFMIMGIGDMSYDNAPLQVSQFESDVRILDQLGKIYFERGGGGNSFESYTGAWYFASRHTDLDCWKRGERGILITLGDEPLNPYLPGRVLSEVTGDVVQDIDTKPLYEEVSEKYDIYHIVITDREASALWRMDEIEKTWGNVLDGQHLLKSESNNLPEVISDIVVGHTGNFATGGFINSDTGVTLTGEGIGW